MRLSDAAPIPLRPKQPGIDAPFNAWLWAEEKFRRLAVALVFTAAAVAVSAAIPGSSYGPAVWLSTILGRMIPTVLLLMLCTIPLKDSGISWALVLAGMYVPPYHLQIVCCRMLLISERSRPARCQVCYPVRRVGLH